MTPDSASPRLSVVVPVFNEAESLPELLSQLMDVLQTLSLPWQIIFVDDGSTDGSWGVIVDLASQWPQVQAIRFRRNFGKAAALQAGFEQATGDIVLTLDADLQDDPAEIPRFLQAIHSGYDVVSGWKQKRHDPWHKVFPSRVFNGMVSWLTGVKLHDHNCGFKAYRAEVLKDLELYGERHRFVPVLAAAKGYKVSELVIHHRARKYGHSKYGFRRFYKGFLDLLTVKMLTSFGTRPQHLFGSLALGPLFLGLLSLFVLITSCCLRYFTVDYGFAEVAEIGLMIFGATFLLLAAILFVAGLLGELIVAQTRRAARAFSIQETLPPRS